MTSNYLVIVLHKINGKTVIYFYIYLITPSSFEIVYKRRCKYRYRVKKKNLYTIKVKNKHKKQLNIQYNLLKLTLHSALKILRYKII